MTTENTTELSTAAPSAQSQTNGIDSNETQRDERKSATERKLVSRLQDAIDDNGRYSYKLKDLSVGYAAGKGITENEAKAEAAKIEMISTAKADAIRREAEALTGNPDLIRLRQIEQWNGILPKFTSGSDMGFLMEMPEQ